MNPGLIFLAILAAVIGFDGARAKPAADLLVLNAHIVTMDAKHRTAGAAVIQGNRIIWAGSTAEAKKRFPDAHAIDLHGATVLPGIIDAHTHLIELGKNLVRLNLKDVATPQEVVERVAQRVKSAAPDEWILGWGWDEGKWASGYPDNHALSDASPRNPVYLVGLHSFAAWANQRALELAGITKDTKEPPNGRIVRDEKTGEPTGVLLNRAQDLVQRQIPPMTLEQTERALEGAAQQCIRVGLTSVHEAKVSAMEVDAFRELIRENRLPIRVYAMLDGADPALRSQWLESGPEIDPNHHLTIRAFKLFADGALGSRGAALLEPYSDSPQSKGTFTTPEPEVYDLTRKSLQRGFQVCTHAIGDAANRMVLDAYAHALADVPQAHDSRLRIEHAQVLSPEDIPRFAKLGIVPSMQPVHATSDMGWAEQRLGPQRIKGAYAWRTLLNTGVPLPLSSDFPGETLNPFYGIYAAITRQDPQGNPAGGWFPEQRLTLEEALRGYTVDAAYAEFEEQAKGSVEPGKLADFIVISQDITKLPTQEILNIRVLKTFVGGKLVYDADPDK
jgi:predicted amidohydrolase YtcJ